MFEFFEALFGFIFGLIALAVAFIIQFLVWILPHALRFGELILAAYLGFKLIAAGY